MASEYLLGFFLKDEEARRTRSLSAIGLLTRCLRLRSIGVVSTMLSNGRSGEQGLVCATLVEVLATSSDNHVSFLCSRSLIGLSTAFEEWMTRCSAALARTHKSGRPMAVSETLSDLHSPKIGKLGWVCTQLTTRSRHRLPTSQHTCIRSTCEMILVQCLPMSCDSSRLDGDFSGTRWKFTVGILAKLTAEAYYWYCLVSMLIICRSARDH